MPYTTYGYVRRFMIRFAESISMDEEALRLLRENNAMLKQILAYIGMKQSSEYRMNEDIRAFSINVCADVFVENMEPEEKEELNNKITGK